MALTRIVAIVNEKGGVGKTTSAVNISADLARKRKKVLLIDSDPQGNATRSVYGGEITNGTLYNVWNHPHDLEEVIIQSEHGFDLLPADGDLSAVGKLSDSYDCLKAITNSLKRSYDFIIIDLPPSLSLLTINGLCAATDVLVPLQPEVLPVDGLKALMETISMIRTHEYNRYLYVSGVFFTMYNDDFILHRGVRHQVEEHLAEAGVKVCSTYIKRTIRFAEAPLISVPAVVEYQKNHTVQAYSRLVREVFGV